LVLGPVLFEQVLEKLYAGLLDGKTEITPLGQNQFRPLADVDDFKIDLAKAQAKWRVDAIVQAHQTRNARKRNLWIGTIAATALIAAAGAASLAKYLAVHNPFKSTATFDDISMEAPTIGLANARAGSEELVDYPLGGEPRRSPGRALEKTKPSALANKTATAKGEAEADGIQTGTFDRATINSVVAARQRSLYPCVAEEASKHPGLSTKIPIEFVIGNDGRVTRVWVDHSLFKSGPLGECLLRELQKWSFKAYEGERATVGLSFRVGKSG
jgi:hypothetical protein